MRLQEATKNTLYNFDFSEFAEAQITKETLQGFRRKASWLLPQLMSFFGSSLKLRKCETTGLYSPTYFIRDNVALCRENKLLYEGNPVPQTIFQGMMRVLIHYPRGDLLNATSQKQTKEGIRYAANVPLVLSAFKEFRNVQYSEWNWQDENMQHLVDLGHQELIPYIVSEELRGTLSKWDSSTLMAIRDEANTKDVPLTSMYSIAVGTDMEFKKLPRLLKLMLCQVWVYHPSIRQALGICSVDDVDLLPEPLTSSDIPTVKELPWGSGPKLQQDVQWGGRRTAAAPKTIEVPWEV